MVRLIILCCCTVVSFFNQFNIKYILCRTNVNDLCDPIELTGNKYIKINISEKKVKCLREYFFSNSYEVFLFHKIRSSNPNL